MNHIFNTDVAKEYGILEAVMLNNFAFWVAKNKANGRHFHDGKYWTYNSTKALAELFPYATPKQIRSALEHLRKEGLLETANYNELKFDRTLWYTLSEKGEEVCLQGHCRLPKQESPFAQEGEAIPDINTDINTYNNSFVEEPRQKIPYKEIVDYLNKVAGTNYKYTAKKTQEHINQRFREGFTFNDFITVIDRKARAWKNDSRMWKYLRPETLFGTKFDWYLNQPEGEMTTRDISNAVDFSALTDFEEE